MDVFYAPNIHVLWALSCVHKPSSPLHNVHPVWAQRWPVWYRVHKHQKSLTPSLSHFSIFQAILSKPKHAGVFMSLSKQDSQYGSLVWLSDGIRVPSTVWPPTYMRAFALSLLKFSWVRR